MSDTSQADKKNYRSSFGATILFSGVQFFQILIGIVKSKCAAIFIGPAGLGIMSLLLSTTDLISATTNLGLKTSGVKSVASSFADNNNIIIGRTITVLRRLVFLTGFIGMLICALFSPIWSNISFGDGSYTFSFILVSVIILIGQLNNGELVLLQGMQERKSLAKANLIGHSLSVACIIPLYYFFGVQSIVWVLVLSALIAFVITKYYTRRLKIPTIRVSWKETFTVGGEMIKLGVFLSLQFLMSQLIVFVVRNYVSSKGGIADVGLYSAGTSIITTYLGLVFSAIATDYFPRLAATKNNEELKSTVQVQAEISILLFAPLIVAFIIFIKPIIVLLYSEEFLSIDYMLYWSIGATLIQSMAWAASHTLLAKAKPYQFFLNELFAAFYSVPLRLVGYSMMGLTGFGIATFLTYSIYLVQEMIVSKKLFGFSYDKTTWKLFIILNILIVLSLIIRLAFPSVLGYIVGSLLLIIITSYSLKVLNEKMGLRSALKSKFSRVK